MSQISTETTLMLVVAYITALKADLNKKYGALSVLNQVIPSMAAELADMIASGMTQQA